MTNNKKQVTYSEAINLALDQALAKNPNVVVFGEDVGGVGGVFRITRGLQAKHGAHRVMDFHIAEAAIAGTAMGMAINGMKPVIELQFSGFMYPASQNIFANIARYRNRTRGRFETPVVMRMPGQYWPKALEHHTESLEHMFASTPGLVVVMPSNAYDAKGLMASAISSKDPVVFFEQIKLYYKTPREEVPEDWYEIPFGKANRIHEGNKLSLVAWGVQVVDAKQAIKELIEENKISAHDVDLIDLRSIQPWDKEMVIESVNKTGKLLVVQEAVRSFTVASEIITTVTESCFKKLKVAPSRLTGWDITIPYGLGAELHVPSVKRIKDRIIDLLNKH